MRSRLTLLLLVSVLCLCPEARSQSRHVFGFSLNPTAQGSLHALFIYTVVDGQVVGSVPIRLHPYIRQASGLEESKANLEALDLFAEFEIRDCGPVASTQGLMVNFDCSPLLDLWKLRYQDGMGIQPGLGWAAEPHRPSERQQIILQHYREAHYTHWHGPYFGTDTFRLLRDLQDPARVETYRRGG